MASANDAVYCIVCGDEVPRDRVARGATTCKNEHADERKQFLRQLKDSKACRYCHRRINTPEQRAALRRFYLLEKTRPDLLYPARFERWSVETGSADVAAFIEWWHEKIRREERSEKPAEAEEPVEVAEAASEPETEESTEKEENWYIFQENRYGRKGQICEILQTKGHGMGLVQIRFWDDFKPVVQRIALRRASRGELKKLDKRAEVESTLARSGEPTEGD